LLQRFYIGIYTGTVEAMPMACLTLAATPIVLNLKKKYTNCERKNNFGTNHSHMPITIKIYNLTTLVIRQWLCYNYWVSQKIYTQLKL
jgi:hypothetical protein